jgi:integrase
VTRRGKGEGNIRKRKDGRWEAAITVGYTAKGNPKRVSVYGRTREDVAAKLFKLGARHGAGLLASPDKVTVSEYLASWLEIKTSDETKPTTLAGYKTASGHINRFLSKVRLQALRAAQIQNMYTQLRKTYKNDAGKEIVGLQNGVNHVHRVFRAALNDAVKLDLLAASPLAKLNAPTLHHVETTVWTAKLFWLALSSGMRRGELLGLQWADIDFPNRVLHIKRNLTTLGGAVIIQTPKTHRSSRAIHLSEEDIAVLQDHRASIEAEHAISSVWQQPEFVFVTHIGTTINPTNLSKAFKGIIASAKVPDIRFHDLRHSSASLAALEGVSPKVLSERLGHATVKFTMDTYQHSYAHQHEEAASTMGKVLKGVEK